MRWCATGHLRRQHGRRFAALRLQRFRATQGQAEFGTRAEIKNVNSFRFIEKAINHEVQRQIELIEDGGKVVQETRLYDPNKDETRPCAARKKPTTTATSPRPAPGGDRAELPR